MESPTIKSMSIIDKNKNEYIITQNEEIDFIYSNIYLLRSSNSSIYAKDNLSKIILVNARDISSLYVTGDRLIQMWIN